MVSTPGWFARLAVAMVINLGAAVGVVAQEPLPSQPALDGERTDSWSRVADVPVGRVVRVEFGAEHSVRGRLVSVEADGLSIQDGHSPRTILRSDIRKVMVVQRQAGRKAKRGLVIGAVAGGLMGRLTAGSTRIAWMSFLAAEWGAIGAAIGAIDGHFHRTETLVYDPSPAKI